MNGIIDELLSGDRRALAKAITILENEDNPEFVREISRNQKGGHVIGITGPPGAGKSTFISSFVTEALRFGKKVGIIAVDPSSPFSGGAILGDRIRMKSHVLREEVFIRSMGTRGALGGLALKTGYAVRAMDAYGMDFIIIETVGVGQSEVDIASMADSVIVVLAPGFGDDIQALKAGILEIADIFIVNKSDLSMAGKLASELEQIVMMNHSEWKIPVIKCSSAENSGFAEAFEAAMAHRDFITSANEGKIRKIKRFENEIMAIVSDKARNILSTAAESVGGFAGLAKIIDGQDITVFDMAEKVLKGEFRG